MTIEARQSLAAAISNAADWLRVNALSAYEVKAKGYPSIQRDYKRTISDALLDYGTSEQGTRATSYQGAFRRAAVEAFQAAFDIGFIDTSGDESQADKDAQDWLNARVESELAYIGELFQSLKSLRDEVFAGDAKVGDIKTFVEDRTAAYINTLGSIYNAGAMWGRKNQMLAWSLGATETHCKTCAGLDGNSHRAKWYITKDYIPRKPGAALLCGGYNCDCKLLDANGSEVTI